jgi:hypothetical protein
VHAVAIPSTRRDAGHGSRRALPLPAPQRSAAARAIDNVSPERDRESMMD